ncbi:MAG: NTP transferase domain-containing protein [Spirochaetales bacterium]|jgi:mannose-1-phosphate guanylyltransferase|nr:NTP transferase domain-containing protein [Spirochaetales bacterium]
MVTIILLAGGESQRLWPFTGGEDAKQFLPLFNGESMLQRTYRKIARQPFVEEILVSTNLKQVSAVKKQLPSALSLCEPYYQGTHAALLLALAFLKEERSLQEGDLVGIIPIDSEAEANYFDAIGAMAQKAKEGIVLMGIEPRKPTSRFGYILSDSDNRVERFVEKPPEEEAERLIAQGALWNGGIALFPLGLFPVPSYSDLLDDYSSQPPLSFDQAVLEKSTYPRFVHPYRGEWDDLGSWPSLLKVVGDKNFGPHTIQGEGTNTTVLNFTSSPLNLVEPQDLLVAMSPKGSLVVHKKHLKG